MRIETLQWQIRDFTASKYEIRSDGIVSCLAANNTAVDFPLKDLISITTPSEKDQLLRVSYRASVPVRGVKIKRLKSINSGLSMKGFTFAFLPGGSFMLVNKRLNRLIRDKD